MHSSDEENNFLIANKAQRKNRSKSIEDSKGAIVATK